MNIVILSGRLASNAVVFGKEQETLKFSVVCSMGYDSKANETRVAYVPCVVFRAPEKLRSLLVGSGKGKPVELKGRITTSSFEKNGSTCYVTEVVADWKDLQLLRMGESKASTSQVSKERYGYASSAAYDQTNPFMTAGINQHL